MESIPRSLTRSPKRSPKAVAVLALTRISSSLVLPDDVRLAVADALARINGDPCRAHRCRVEDDGSLSCIYCKYREPNPDALLRDLKRVVHDLEAGRPATRP